MRETTLAAFQTEEQQELFFQKKTDFWLGFYVFLGLALLVCSSKASLLLKEGLTRKYAWTYIGIFVYALTTALITVVYRRVVIRAGRKFYEDPTILSKPDTLTIQQGLFSYILGFAAFMLPPRCSDPMPILMFALMMTSVGLNTYFGRFWHQDSMGANPPTDEALKLAHAAWTTIFGNVCSALMVGFIGALIAKGSLLVGPSLNSPDIGSLPLLKPYLDVFLVMYALLGSPILWLLRPINATLASIRLELVYRETQRLVSKDGP